MVLAEVASPEDISSWDDKPSMGDDSALTGSNFENMQRIVHEATLPNAQTLRDLSMKLTDDAFSFRYRLGRGGIRQHAVRFDQMPLQGFSRYAAFGTSMKTMVTAVQAIETLGGIESSLGRPLSQSEVEGMVCNIGLTRGFDLAGFWGGLALGGAFAFHKKKTFKFPFRAVKPVENYDAYPMKRFPMFNGQAARKLWHGNRWLAYSVVSWAFLMPYLGFLGSQTRMMLMIRDRRTHEVFTEYKKLRRSQLQKRQGLTPTRVERLDGESDAHGDEQLPKDPDQQAWNLNDTVNPSSDFEDNNSPTVNSGQYPSMKSEVNTSSVVQSPFRPRKQANGPPVAAEGGSSSSSSSSSPQTASIPSLFDSTYDNTSPSLSKSQEGTSESSLSSSWAQIRAAAQVDGNPSSSLSSFSPDSQAQDSTANRRGILPSNVRQSRAQSAALARRRQQQQQQRQQQQPQEYQQAPPIEDEKGSVDSFFAVSPPYNDGNVNDNGFQNTNSNLSTQNDQSQAQREFNERMDRERRLGDVAAGTSSVGADSSKFSGAGSRDGNAAEASAAAGKRSQSGTGTASVWERRRRREIE